MVVVLFLGAVSAVETEGRAGIWLRRRVRVRGYARSIRRNLVGGSGDAQAD